jgi:hypothetical protein
MLGLVPLIFSCQDNTKRLNRRITLWRKDKIPYGTYYTFENLHHVFPKAVININKKSPAEFLYDREEFNNEDHGKRKSRKVYIIIAKNVVPDDKEMNALMNFVGNGNILFISAFHIGDSLLSNLGLRLNDKFNLRPDSLELSLYNAYSYDSLPFVYPGYNYDDAVANMDSAYTSILGRDRLGDANFVKFGYKGGGAVFVHFAPLALSNFFLLHKENKAYFDNVFSYMTPNATEVIWDDYYRYPPSGFSAFQYIFSNESLRWAFWLTILLFGIVYVIESKRRQKMIPSKPALANTTLDFVKTIGRLYYQRRDNGNLAAKMGQHFLDHVRNRYNLSTAVLDDKFVDRLAYKSGYEKEELAEIVENIAVYQNHVYVSDDSLVDFNNKIEAFYKQR